MRVSLALAFVLAVKSALAASPVARLEILEVAGQTLRGNPLNDPVARRAAVFVPQQAKEREPLPVVYYLPGYGGSAEDYIAQGERSPFAALVQQLADRGLPLVLAIPDARNRWGGSQYLNSSAQGNYSDYVADEIVAAVEARHPCANGRAGRIVAGHSSGGYGALILGMARQKTFGAVIGLAPDSDFEVTHRPVVERPNIRRVTPREVVAFSAPTGAPRPADGLVELVLGLSAAYAPVGPSQPGRFHWLYNDAGEFQPQVWQQWLDRDPLLLVRKNTGAFAADQRIYLDGCTHDDWGFNVSARKIYDILRERGAKVTFDEPPGGHSDRIPERLARAIVWVLGK